MTGAPVGSPLLNRRGLVRTRSQAWLPVPAKPWYSPLTWLDVHAAPFQCHTVVVQVPSFPRVQGLPVVPHTFEAPSTAPGVRSSGTVVVCQEPPLYTRASPPPASKIQTLSVDDAITAPGRSRAG